MMEIALWAVILFAAVYEPIVGYIGFRRFKIKAEESEKARSRYYVNVMAGLWVPAIFIIFLTATTEIRREDIGLALPAVNTATLGPWATYITFGLILIYTASLLYYLIGYRLSEKIRITWNEASVKELGDSGFKELLPVTADEKKLWNYVSLTAGVTEEIIYRGFLIFAFSHLFPGFPIWLVILSASVLFGLAHTYQGITGVVKTTIVGVLFSILYIGLGSIVPIILLHFLLDYMAKLGNPIR